MPDATFLLLINDMAGQVGQGVSSMLANVLCWEGKYGYLPR